jgi:heat shock protein HslJ
MNQDFEDRLRVAIARDGVEIPADAEAAIRDGRRIVRGRRVGWGVLACAVVAAAVLILPGMAPRGVRAVPAQPAATASSPASGLTLAGTEWRALKLEGAALRPGSSITLRFGDGWVDGFGGCNHYGYTEVDGKIEAGAFREDGDRLTIAPVATTAMGCINGVGDQEGRYLQALRGVERFSMTGGGLTLFGSDGSALLQFEPATAVLERSGWTVTAIQGMTPLADPRQPSLVFLNATVVGYDGCNSVSGTVSGELDNLKLSVHGGTFKLCTGETIRTQQKNFTAALLGASRAVIQGDQLTLVNGAGTPLLQATADPARLLAAEGATWRLDNKDGRWGAGKDSAITLQVNDDLLSGKTGCGDYKAPYEHSGDAWTVSGLQTFNDLPCASGTSAYAQRFIEVVQQVTTVQVAQDQLRLVTPDKTLTFTRQ